MKKDILNKGSIAVTMSVLLATLFLLLLVSGVVSSVVYIHWELNRLTVMVSNAGGGTVSAGPVAIIRRYDHANLVVTADPSLDPPDPTAMTLIGNYYPLVFSTNQTPVFGLQTTNSNSAKFSLAGVNSSSNNRIIYTADFASFEDGVISLNISTSCQVHITGPDPVELRVGIGYAEDTTSLSSIIPIYLSTVYFNTGLPVNTDFNFAMSCVYLVDATLLTNTFAIFPIIQSINPGSEFSTRSIALSVQETPFHVKSF